jgi:hypothetical protein
MEEELSPLKVFIKRNHLNLDINGDHIGPLRVWLKNEDIPGLAMTRSMGDIAGSMAGVIAEPGIFKLFESNEF